MDRCLLKFATLTAERIYMKFGIHVEQSLESYLPLIFLIPGGRSHGQKLVDNKGEFR